jgi:hypothetical protein
MSLLLSRLIGLPVCDRASVANAGVFGAYNGFAWVKGWLALNSGLCVLKWDCYIAAQSDVGMQMWLFHH